MGKNIAVFSEKKAKTAIHPAMPEISRTCKHFGNAKAIINVVIILVAADQIKFIPSNSAI